MLPSHKTKYSLQSLLKLLLPPIMWVNGCASRGLQIQSTDRLMQAAWDTQGFLLLQKDCSLGFLADSWSSGAAGRDSVFHPQSSLCPWVFTCWKHKSFSNSLPLLPRSHEAVILALDLQFLDWPCFTVCFIISAKGKKRLCVFVT